MGVRVPTDRSVVTAHDIPLVANVVPLLATVRTPLGRLGERAVGLLLSTRPHRPICGVVGQPHGARPAGVDGAAALFHGRYCSQTPSATVLGTACWCQSAGGASSSFVLVMNETGGRVRGNEAWLERHEHRHPSSQTVLATSRWWQTSRWWRTSWDFPSCRASNYQFCRQRLVPFPGARH